LEGISLPIERIQPEGLFTPPNYVHVARAGRTVYIAGQVARDSNGNVVGKGDVTAQATQAFENLKKALASVGADFSHLVRFTVYLTDASYQDAVTAVRARYITGALPVATVAIIKALGNPDMLVEIEGTAFLD
jgi:enamine deaminase RidA (YjgF/YER057c/UK114 family)